jgi:hypothetical protein
VGARVRPLSVLALPMAGALALSGCSSGDNLPAGESDDDEECPDGEACGAGEKGAGADELQPPANSGSVAVTLHPGPQAAIGEPTVVSFGVPFARGALTDAAAVAATGEDGAELPVHAEEILPWRSWSGDGGATSVRAAMVSVQVTFAERTPTTITLALGQAGAPLDPPADPRADWVEVTDGEYPNGTVREPRVYATLPAAWLSDSQLRTRTTEAGSDPAWAWFDESMLGSAHTAVNDVPAEVTELVPYTADYEPWLFDRAATLFGVYARTGEVDWLRRAHRAAQFYAAHIDGAGYFDLKEDPDLKYSYGRSLLIDFVFTGDPALLDTIERIASAGREWDPTYDMETNFWTERHQTYALTSALVAWEASGDKAHADRAREIAQTSFAMAADPAGSWQADGCMLHGMTAHEGAGGDVPVCSPWMSALFADAVWQYYSQTEDPEALDFLASMGTFVAEYGLYDGGEDLDFTLPWYLASSVKTFSDDGPWGDVEHTCDVAGLVARAAWAEKQRGGDAGELRSTAEQLLQGCAWNLEQWHRPAGPDAGKAEWRISPPRKFNWWFGTTSDLPWLMSEIGAG